MEIFDFNKIKAFPYEKRERNVLYKSPNFKMRIIELPEGGKMPECDMDSSVIFYVLEGEVSVRVNGRRESLSAGQAMVTKPAVLSMETSGGVRIMGIQAAAK